MIVRELLALLGFKVDKKSEKGVLGSLGKVKKIAAAIAGIFVTGKVAQAINRVVTETAALGDRLDKTSQKLGVNVQALQELRFAAEQNGVTIQQFDVGLQRFIRRAAEAADGTGVAKDALKDLGVQLRDNNGVLRPAEDLLGDVADGFSRMESQADRVKVAFKLFDTEGVALVNVLQGGSAGLDEFRARARELGGVLDRELIDLSSEYTDTQNEMNKSLQGVKNVIARILLPIWIQFSQAVRDLAIELRGPMRRAIKVIVEIFRAVARVLRTVVQGWLAVNDLIVLAARDYLGLNKTLTQTVIIITALVAVLGLPVVLLGLIGAAIFLVIDDLITMGEGGESVIGNLITGFGDLIDELGGVGGAIDQVLTNAVEFWLQALGISEENAEAIADAILNPFDKVLELFEIIRDTIADLFTGDTIGKIKELAGAFFEGDETTAGRRPGARVGAPAALTAPAGAGGGISNIQTASIKVDVNATSGQSPEEIGTEVARQVDHVLEKRNREAFLQLTTAGIPR